MSGAACSCWQSHSALTRARANLHLARPPPRPLLAKKTPSRGLEEGLVLPELLIPSCFCRS